MKHIVRWISYMYSQPVNVRRLQVPSSGCIRPIWACFPPTIIKWFLYGLGLGWGNTPQVSWLQPLVWGRRMIHRVDIIQYSHWIVFFSPRPTRMKKPQQKKCHGVKTYAHIFPLGRQSNAKKWNKERALASLSPSAWSHRSCARNSWIYDDAEVLPQSLRGSFLQEPVF